MKEQQSWNSLLIAYPFYLPQKGWICAIDLRAGDILVTINGEYVIVEKVQHEILESPIKVYNFEVEDFHTYYVGCISVFVHNDCSATRVFDDNQQAVLDLAHEYKRGISQQESEILVDWAKEYGISSHYSEIHPGRSGIWSTKFHIKIKNYHIPIIK